MRYQKITTPLQILGLPDDFTEQGSQAELYQQYGLTAQGIINTITPPDMTLSSMEINCWCEFAI
jgi:transketolase C-terminal domain/subunit